MGVLLKKRPHTPAKPFEQKDMASSRSVCKAVVRLHALFAPILKMLKAF